MEEDQAKIEEEKTIEVFETMSVPKAVFRNAIPAMVAVLFTIVYNLADTYFIGLTHDDLQVAAVSLCGPLFTIFTAIGTIFGMGGTSVISRAMGEGRRDYCRKVCSFCMWTGLACGVVLLVAYFIFMKPLLSVLGASTETWDYAKNYLQMIALAGPFAIIPSTFSNIIRCEGRSTAATIGMIGGNILNIILDPVLILACNMGTRGAGLATLISMIVATAYYVGYFLKGKSILSIKLKDYSAKEHIVPNVLAIGIPACLASLMISFSTMIVHAQMAKYSDMALAAIGIALKVLMVATMLAGGIGQGIQAILGYCVGARKWKRFKSCLNFSMWFAFIFCAVIAIVCFIFAKPIVGLFLTETESITYATSFTRIVLWTSPIVGMFYVLANTLQAMGAAIPALVLNLSRQGYIFIPVLFIMKAIMGMNGLVWAQPISDIISFIISIVLLVYTFRSLQKKSEKKAIEQSEDKKKDETLPENSDEKIAKNS